MAPCWSAKEVFASLDLLCTVAVKHLIFIIASNFISSELMEEGLKNTRVLSVWIEITFLFSSNA